MSLYSAAKQYAAYTTAHQTINKTRQVVMLYEGVIKLIKQAKDAIIRKDIQQRYNLLDKACTIILGLQSSLDFQQGGDIAKLLQEFYTSIDLRLITIQSTNDLAMCDQVIKELESMKAAWADVDAQCSGGSSSTAAPTTSLASNNSIPANSSTSSSVQVSI